VKGGEVKTPGSPTLPPSPQTTPQTDSNKGTPTPQEPKDDTNLPKPPTPKSSTPPTDSKKEEPAPPTKDPSLTTVPPTQSEDKTTNTTPQTDSTIKVEVPGKPTGDIPPAQPGSSDTKKEEPKKEPSPGEPIVPPSPVADEKPKGVMPPIVPGNGSPKPEEPQKEPSPGEPIVPPLPGADEKPKGVIPPIVPGNGTPKPEEPQKEPPTTPAKQGEPTPSGTADTGKPDDDKTSDPKMAKNKGTTGSLDSILVIFSKIHDKSGKQNEKLFALLNQEAYAKLLVSVSEAQLVKLREILKINVFSPVALSKLIPTADSVVISKLYAKVLNCLIGPMSIPKLLDNILGWADEYKIEMKRYFELLEYSLKEYTSNASLWNTEDEKQKIKCIHDACNVPDELIPKKSDKPKDDDKKTKDPKPDEDNKTKPDEGKKTKPDEDQEIKDPKPDEDKKAKVLKTGGTDALPNKGADYKKIIITVSIVGLFVAILCIAGYLYKNRN
jgi:hypothetical protein